MISQSLICASALKNGLEIIPELVQANPQVRIVVLTGYGSIATATKAIKFGAVNYLIKPASIKTILEALSEPKDAESGSLSQMMPTLAENERQYIEFVLEKCDGNKSAAAMQLNIPRQSLQRKLRKYSPWKSAREKK